MTSFRCFRLLRVCDKKFSRPESFTNEKFDVEKTIINVKNCKINIVSFRKSYAAKYITY